MSTQRLRRIDVNPLNYKAYDLQEAEKMKIFLQSVNEIETLGFIKVEWKKFEKGNLLHKLVLCESKVDTMYTAIGRVPKSDILKKISIELHELREKEKNVSDQTNRDRKWMQIFLEKCFAELQKGEIPTLLVSAKDKKRPTKETLEGKERKDLYKLLSFSGEGNELSERYISSKLYGDSKWFEKNVRSKIVAILKSTLSVDIPIEESKENSKKEYERQLLEVIGIYKNPTEIFFKGAIKYFLNGKEIETQNHIYGTSINSMAVHNMNIESLYETGIRKIITIENKSTYYAYIKGASQDELVIYTNGFFGSVMQDFLKKLKRAKNKENNKGKIISFYHWSDIDLGGFQIMKYLGETLEQRIEPFYMDIETYHKYYAKEYKLKEESLKKIAILKEDTYLCHMKELMEEVLKVGYGLEQERIEI